MQLASRSLGILRDVYNRLDVLKTRGRLTLVDPYTSLLIIIIKNALSIGTKWLYLLYNLKIIIMTEGFKELLKLAKAAKVKTYDELQELVYECKNEITGGDFECVRAQLKISMF